jgi:hypothetical protein
MSFYESENQGQTEFENPKEGFHTARPVVLAFTGTTMDEWKGQPKLKHQLIVMFELETKRSDGKPFTIPLFLNVSVSKFGGFYASSRSNAHKILVGWLKEEKGSLKAFANAVVKGIPAQVFLEEKPNKYMRIDKVKPAKDAPVGHTSGVTPIVWGVGDPVPESLPAWIVEQSEASFQAKGEPIPVIEFKKVEDLLDSDVPF